ncbi:MAG: hypothetical protein ACRDKE_10935, partial [Solirubrobacterales bacterium]
SNLYAHVHDASGHCLECGDSGPFRDTLPRGSYFVTVDAQFAELAERNRSTGEYSLTRSIRPLRR